MKAGREIDARGLLCPLPVLKARKALQDMREGSILRLIATDPASWIDVPHFCAEGGHSLVSATDDGDGKTYLIRRGPVA
jgi:tRNA 2-thiouridine synthesizing protein A